ncbi:MAG: GNAT family N-acetyltransferase [Acidobacteriales bacterium]|nr:GNAT family N-acetyltransferase [Terriglobales bacterium]
MNSEISVVMTKATESPKFWYQIAGLHQREIREGFLSTLGRKFLALLYASIVASDQAFLLAGVGAGGEVVGFICVTVDTSSVLKRCIWQSWFRLTVALLPQLFSWRVLVKVFETLRYASDGGDIALPRAEILNFCVGDSQQGKGIGRCLFAAATSELKRRGVARIKIVTGESQTRAQKFYDSAHARRVGGVQVHKGVKSVVFIYETTQSQ